MKAILEFDLSEEMDMFELHKNGPDYHSSLLEIEKKLRHLRKYEDIESKTAEEVLEIISNCFYNEIESLKYY